MMRQLSDGGHVGPRLKTPDAGSQSSLDIRMPSVPVNVKVNRPVCLPVLSENNKLLWVYSRQIDELELDLVEELDKAFDRFPYLTKEQTTELAQRCSLHPDQVKVWFMAQRLQCGVSWDYEDICEMWSNFRSSREDGEENEDTQNWGAGEMEDDRRQKKNLKDKTVESGEYGEKEGGMRAQKVRASRQKPKKAKSKVQEDKASTPKEEKSREVTDKRRKMNVKQDEDTERAGNMEVERDASENEGQTCTESEGAVLTKRKKREEKEQVQSGYENPVEFDLLLGATSALKLPTQTFKIIPATENLTNQQERADIPHTISDISPVYRSSEETTKLVCLEEDPQAVATDQNNVVPDEDRRMNLTTVDISALVTERPPSTKTSLIRKTQVQRMMMKAAFFHCQYPDSSQYTFLAEQIGIPRNSLVQWYADMRYALKRSKPRWMNNEKYKQVLANIKHRQCMTEQSKLLANPSD